MNWNPRFIHNLHTRFEASYQPKGFRKIASKVVILLELILFTMFSLLTTLFVDSMLFSREQQNNERIFRNEVRNWTLVIQSTQPGLTITACLPLLDLTSRIVVRFETALKGTSQLNESQNHSNDRLSQRERVHRSAQYFSPETYRNDNSSLET